MGRDFDEADHPRWPANTPGSRGGEFAPAGAPAGAVPLPGADAWVQAVSSRLPGGSFGPTGLKSDRLKLAGKVEDLVDGEELIGSDKVVGEWSATLRVAVTSHGVRLGVGGAGFGGRDDDAGPWRAGRGDLAEENARRKRLSDERSALEEMPEDPPWTPEQQRRYDELDDTDTNELYPLGFTTVLDRAGVERLRQAVAEFWPRAAARSKEINDVWEKIEALREQRMRLWDLVMKETTAGVPVERPADYDAKATDAEIERLFYEIEALEESPAAKWDYVLYGEGVIPGQWGDLHYRIDLDDPGIGPQLRLAVVPRGDPAHDTLDKVEDAEAHAVFEEGEVPRVLALLGKIVGG